MFRGTPCIIQKSVVLLNCSIQKASADIKKKNWKNYFLLVKLWSKVTACLDKVYKISNEREELSYFRFIYYQQIFYSFMSWFRTNIGGRALRGAWYLLTNFFITSKVIIWSSRVSSTVRVCMCGWGRRSILLKRPPFL